MKLVVREPESNALRELVEAGGGRASSDLLSAEIPRALRRCAWSDPSADPVSLLARGEAALGAMYLIALSRPMLALAGSLEGPLLRALDAIHVATAISYPARLQAFVSYDQRQLEAAQAAGLAVTSPGV